MTVRRYDAEYPEGMMSYHEAKWLEVLAAGLNPPGLIVEVGSWKGMSTVALGRGARKSGSRVVAIDWGKGSPRDWDRPGFEEAWDYWKDLKDNLQKYGVADLVQLVKKDVEDILARWPHGEIGMLFLDGEHQADQVEKELRGFLPHLRNGAIIALHDYLSYPGVGQGVGRVFGPNGLTYWGMANTLAAFQLAASSDQEGRTSRRPLGPKRQRVEALT